MHDTSPAHRAMCSTCLRPQKTCICAWVTPVQHHVEVLILQHPLEAANPKGSARLLHLCLPHSRLVVEEVFEEQALRQLLTGPWSALPGDAPPNTQYTVQPLLLYPATPGKAAQPRPDWLGDAAALALPQPGPATRAAPAPARLARVALPHSPGTSARPAIDPGSDLRGLDAAGRPKRAIFTVAHGV